MVCRQFHRRSRASRAGAGDLRSGARPRSRLSLRPGCRRFRDGLSVHRALAAWRARSRARACRQDDHSIRRLGTPCDLDLWDDAQADVRDCRRKRRAGGPGRHGAVQRRARARHQPVDQFRRLLGSLGGIALGALRGRPREYSPGCGPVPTEWDRHLSAARVDVSGGSGSADRRNRRRARDHRAGPCGR